MRYALFYLLTLTSVGQNALADPLKVMTWSIRYNYAGDGVNAWRETIRRAGKLVITATAIGTQVSFDFDEVRIEGR